MTPEVAGPCARERWGINGKNLMELENVYCYIANGF